MRYGVGTVTRGTTARGRLRRLDRWLLASHPGLVATDALLAVDVGFGAVPVTTADLHRRLQAVHPGARVVGLDLDPARVRAAQAWVRPQLSFRAGGFELAGLRPDLVRAANVLRQYDEDEVLPAWQLMSARLAPGGAVFDATCDESGRLGAWVTLRRCGPTALTLAFDPLRPPGAVAARLPKVLIHHNVPGEPVHQLLRQLDEQWRRSAALATFGPRQRLAAAISATVRAGWSALDGPARWRRGELTVPWTAVAPWRWKPVEASVCR